MPNLESPVVERWQAGNGIRDAESPCGHASNLARRATDSRRH